MNQMTEWILAVSKKMNVTGSEKDLLSFLKETLDPAGEVSSFDAMGSLLFRFGNRSTLLTAPADVPGFLMLLKDSGKSFLVPTIPELKREELSSHVQNANGQTFPLYHDDASPRHYFVKRKDFTLGTPFKEAALYREQNGQVEGLFAARYAVLYLLTEFAKKRKINVLFCAQGVSNAPTEYNACLKEGFDQVIFLGRYASNQNNPLVMIRDGKQFSDSVLVEKALEAGFSPACSETPVTKAYLCANSGAKTLTLALPCQNPDSPGERFSLDTSYAFFDQLERFFK